MDVSGVSDIRAGTPFLECPVSPEPAFPIDLVRIPPPGRGGRPIARFRPRSTWLLLFPAFIALGVYYGHYTLRQTRALAPCLPEDEGRQLLAASHRVLIMGDASLAPVAAPWFLPLSAGAATAVGVPGNTWPLRWLLMHSIWLISSDPDSTRTTVSGPVHPTGSPASGHPASRPCT
nr:hypothetical protein [Pseudoxanthomonas sp.]